MRLLIKFIRFTGIWAVLIRLIVLEYVIMPLILGGKQMTKLNFPNIYNTYEKIVLITRGCYVVLFTTRSIIQIFNPNFLAIKKFRGENY